MTEHRTNVGTPIPPGQGLAAIRPAPRASQPAENAIDQLTERFEPRDPMYRLADVILSEATRRDVDSMLAKIRYREELYGTWQLRQLEPCGERLAFNFYGPPGTGKTMLAEALAHELDKRVIEVSYAEIESRYVGDTPKNIVAAFRSAEQHGAALFFDEADSILGRRMTQVTQAADHGVNVSRAVMLKQLDRFSGTVMFATNLARNFDDAFVRRIPYHVPLPPPDRAGLEALWRRLIPSAVPGRSELDFASLADQSSGLVGGDVKNAIVLGAADAVQRVGEHKRIMLDDLVRGIESVRRAKRDVGSHAAIDS